PRQIGLARDHVETAEKALIETRVLTEIVGAQDDVELAHIDRVVEALRQMPGMAGHPGETDLSLLPRLFGKLVPFRVLQPLDVVDRVIEVDIDVVGPEAAEAAFERPHNRATIGVGPRERLGREKNLISFAAERPAERRFRIAAPIRLGGIEIVDSTVEGME